MCHHYRFGPAGTAADSFPDFEGQSRGSVSLGVSPPVPPLVLGFGHVDPTQQKRKLFRTEDDLGPAGIHKENLSRDVLKLDSWAAANFLKAWLGVVSAPLPQYSRARRNRGVRLPIGSWTRWPERRFLGQFEGIPQTDGYPAYDEIGEPSMTHAACWSK
jgi:hypothetical protein